EREGETIAEAGRPGSVTIATNMAGRGVDIKLGGSPEHLARDEMAARGIKRDDPEFDARYQEILAEKEEQVSADREKVVEAGGLFIVGTERHESRRIDNQLRGRSGRQGDPGESRFFLSAEDDLVRLFAGDRIYKILDRLGATDEEGNEEPIEAGMLSKQIEKAQRKVEEQNFLIRKRVLEYDDVMNEQRRVVYAYRDEVLEGSDLGEQAREEITGVVERMVDEFTPGDYVEDWDLEGLFVGLTDIMPVGSINERLNVGDIQGGNPDRESLTQDLVDEAMALYDAREQELGDELMRALERYLLLQTIDQRWKEHLYDMDYLREGIHLRGFAQIEPIVAYKNEAFTLFTDLMNSIWSDFARMVYHVDVEVEVEEDPSLLGAPTVPLVPGPVSYSSGGGPGALAEAASGGVAAGVAYAEEEVAFEEPVPVEQRRLDDEEQIGRNDPCWCGSGKKYKKCHGA
ncbi:MAG: SEC-C metal-binding domain-containing protein, partial [Solirubrobacterales bacterium]